MVMPQNLLEKSLNKQVVIKLKDGRIMEGKLVGYDEYMNMVLEGTEEENKEGIERELHEGITQVHEGWGSSKRNCPGFFPLFNGDSRGLTP